jgi:hypothetical protein
MQTLGNTLDQLDRQSAGELHPQLVAARDELIGVGFPRGDIFLLADLRVARAQPRQRSSASSSTINAVGRFGCA